MSPDRSSEPTVVVIGGDGIGPAVVAEAVHTLRDAGFAGGFVEAPAGWSHWLATGEALPATTSALVAQHGLCLFGATTSGTATETARLAAQNELPPWRSPILELRRSLDLDISLRPARSFPGNPGNVARRTATGDFEELPVDMVIVRQNSEGLYAGVEWHPVPADFSQLLAMHHRWNPDWSDADTAVTLRVVTRRAAERLIAAAISEAVRRREDRIVVAEKPNVLRATSGLVVDTAHELAARYEGVAIDVRNIDAVLMKMTMRPDTFGVIATTNLFGDLLSDAAAGLVGGPGFVPSANLGDTAAIFEPVHGSAPDIAGQGRANPVAAILSAAMLADYARQPDVAGSIRSAVARMVADGAPTGTAAIGRAVRSALA